MSAPSPHSDASSPLPGASPPAAPSRPAAGRTIAIGDVHGCSNALAALVERIDLRPDDVLVPLGDYVDRGPDSRGVIEILLAARARCRVVPLKGNHEVMLERALEKPGEADELYWRAVGGERTLESYGGSIDCIPPAHREFYRTLGLYHETDGFLFMHACYVPDLPLCDQTEDDLLWRSLHRGVPAPHVSGKTAVVGHTAQRNGLILHLGHIVCIDTCCHAGGPLTALEPATMRVWQSLESGLTRTGRLAPDGHFVADEPPPPPRGTP